MKRIEQEFVRVNLINFLQETKTKQSDVAKAINIPPDVLSRFKNGNRNQMLYAEHLNRLADYLKDKGYDKRVFESPEI